MTTRIGLSGYVWAQATFAASNDATMQIDASNDERIYFSGGARIDRSRSEAAV
jgi:hypothetical protein